MAYEPLYGERIDDTIDVPNTFSPEKYKSTYATVAPQPTVTPTAPIGGASPATQTQGLTPQQLLGIGNIMNMNDQFLQAQLASMQAQGNAQIAATQAQGAGMAAERDRLNYQLKSGLRDIGQATEEGLEGATHNATQRGIYNSGVRIENQDTVRREGAEAEQDLRAQVGFSLRALNERAGAIRSQISAIRQSIAAAQAQQASQHGLEQNMWLGEVLGAGVDMAAFEDMWQALLAQQNPATDQGIQYG